jgi:DNA-binding IclR family transcriptional regulator
MIEILRLLERIEYGLDEQEIATSLAITAEEALANCQVLEQEMFVHHNDEHGQWFIGQRGLEFLRLHGQSS